MKKTIITVALILVLLAAILAGCERSAVQYPEQMPEDFDVRFVWAIGT